MRRPQDPKTEAAAQPPRGCHESPGKPGAHKAVAYLKPHFQLDEITAAPGRGITASGGVTARHVFSGSNVRAPAAIKLTPVFE